MFLSSGCKNQLSNSFQKPSMKKLFFSLFSFFAISPLFSQITTLSDAELGFGFETAILRSDLKKTYNTGIGGSAKFAYNFTKIIIE